MTYTEEEVVDMVAEAIWSYNDNDMTPEKCRSRAYLIVEEFNEAKLENEKENAV